MRNDSCAGENPPGDILDGDQSFDTLADITGSNSLQVNTTDGMKNIVIAGRVVEVVSSLILSKL